MSILAVEHLTKFFDHRQVLSDVSFQINEGEYIVILGPSGCGKTTILKIIAGLYQPDEGQVIVNGQNVTELAPEYRNIGYFPQQYALFPHLTVAQNVGYGPFVQGKNKSEIQKIVAQYLEMVGLEKWGNHLPKNISGGMQ